MMSSGLMAGVHVEDEIKAQYSNPGILSLQFVNHNSTLRLRRVRE